MKMNYLDIRKYSPIQDFRTRSIADLICMSVSPFLSLFFIAKKVRPNSITLLMILSGCVGAVLFALPWGIAKLAGIFFFYMWYILDCSDGEVARVTKCFSKYGKEFDYLAHLICHPLMNLALWISYIQLDKYDSLLVSFCFITFISLELVIRNYISFETYLNEEGSVQEVKKKNTLRYFLVQFCIYPNFILIFPIFFCLDYYMDIPSFAILCLFLFSFLLLVVIGSYKNLRIFYNG